MASLSLRLAKRMVYQEDTPSLSLRLAKGMVYREDTPSVHGLPFAIRSR